MFSSSFFARCKAQGREAVWPPSESDTSERCNDAVIERSLVCASTPRNPIPLGGHSKFQFVILVSHETASDDQDGINLSLYSKGLQAPLPTPVHTLVFDKMTHAN